MLPEAMCDGGILFHIDREVQKVLVFAAYLGESTKAAVGGTRSQRVPVSSHRRLTRTLRQRRHVQLEASYRFARQAARLIGQSALEDLVDPSGSRGGVAVVVLAVQRAVCEAAVGLLLLPLLLEQICDGVQQVVQELVGILLHVVVKQLCGKGEEIRHLRPLRRQHSV